MGYVIAAYVVVVGSLVAYGLWVNAGRRALRRGHGGGSPPAAVTGRAER